MTTLADLDRFTVWAELMRGEAMERGLDRKGVRR